MYTYIQPALPEKNVLPWLMDAWLLCVKCCLENYPQLRSLFWNHTTPTTDPKQIGVKQAEASVCGFTAYGRIQIWTRERTISNK